MTFEEWWDAPKTVKQITASTKDIAQQAYAAGRESMRQECLQICEKWHDSLASEPEMLEIAEEIRELK